MRIANLNTRDISGGAARAAWRAHKGLVKIGVCSKFLCLQKTSHDSGAVQFDVDSSPDALKSSNQMSHYQKVVDSKRTKQNGEWFSLPVPGYDLSKHPVVIDANIIHLHWVAGMISPESLAALQKLDKPIVWTLHDQRPFTGGCHYSDGCDRYRTNCEECPQLQPDLNHLAKANLANLLRYLDPIKLTIVAPSAWLAECARRSQAFRRCRVEVIPYGVEVDIFKRIGRAHALKTFSLPHCPSTFLFGAENILNARKGINILAGAIQKCILDRDFLEALNQGKLRFLTFGVNGVAFKNFPWIRDLGVLNSDELMAAAYSASDAFICPSLEDNLPNTVLESMASGTPCIASRVGGIPDMITHGVDGWMFPVGDSAALASRLAFFLKNPESNAKAGLAARSKMESQFALETQAKRYLSLYEELLAFHAKGVVLSVISPSQVSKETINEAHTHTAITNEMEKSRLQERPIFSVITVVRNAKKTFPATAESVLDQKGVNFEWIIVDGISTDGTLDLIKGINDPRADFVSEKDSGIYDAMNKGIRRARGEFLCFMNADDLFFSESVLADIASSFQNNTDIGMIYSNFIKTLDTKILEEFKYPFPVTYQWLSLGNFCHQATFFRKSLFEKLGGYDVSFKLLADYRWNVQAILSGVKIGFFASNTCYFSLGGAHLLPSNAEIFADERKQILEILKTAKRTGTIDSKMISPRGGAEQAGRFVKQVKNQEPAKGKSAIERNPKRVVVFSDEPGQGGGAHYAHSILLALAKSGAEVFSAQPQWESPLLEEQRNSGVKHVWTAFNPVAEFGRSLTDREDPSRILDEVQPDVILFSDCCPVSHVAAKNAAMDRLIPFVTTCHIDAPYLADRFKSVLGQVEKQYAYASEVVAVSSSVLEMLRQKFGVDRNRGRVIYNGRADRFFTPPDIELRSKLRLEIGVSEDAVICFTAARMVNEKGHIFQIEAAKRLRDHGKLGNLHFVWAGEGNLSPQLKKIVHKESLTEHFHFLGYRWDIEDWLSAADIFVLSSRLEAFPLCIIEAMAKGLPVVASAIAGVPEQMGSTGALLPDPNRDPQATITKLVEVIGQWAGNPNIRKQVGALAKERASKLFREDQMCRQTLELLTKASASDSQELAVRRMNAMLRSRESMELLNSLRIALEKPVSNEFLLSPELSSFPLEELESIKTLISKWKENPGNKSLSDEVCKVQQRVISCLVNLKDQLLPALYSGYFGEAYRLLLEIRIQDFTPKNDLNIPNNLLSGFQKSGDFMLTRMVASMLVTPAYQSPAMLAVELLPSWIRNDFWNYIWRPPETLCLPNEAEKYASHLKVWLREALRRISSAPNDPLTREFAASAAKRINLIPAYCTNESNRELMEWRAKVIEFTLRQEGVRLDYEFQTPSGNNRKIKIGILNAHFGFQTETFVTLPALHLNKEIFEISLFATYQKNDSVESKCRSLADHWILLPDSIPDSAKMIRDANLDAIIIGTNITAVTNKIAILSAFRLAPLQILSHCSPMTSGFRNMDAVLYGDLAYDKETSDQEFTERLLLMEGAPICLDYGEEATTEPLTNVRSHLQIPEDAVVYLNAASCYKIPWELMDLWARILKEVPNSFLCLMPFNRNWANKFPEKQFHQMLAQFSAKHGLPMGRIKVIASLPNRSQVKNIERVADIYLDTMPFSGSIATVDPLEIGIPVIACDGATTRSRCSGAQLRELDLQQLISSNAQEYFNMAVRLGKAPSLRNDLSTKIKTAMAQKPRFLDPVRYGQNLGRLLESIIRKKSTPLEPQPVITQKPNNLSTPSISRTMTSKKQSPPLKADVSFQKALELHKQDRIDEAEQIYRDILKISPKHFDSIHMLGVVCRQKKNLPEALRLLKWAVSLNKNNPAACSNLGNVLNDLGHYEEAFAAFSKAIKLKPDFTTALNNRANCLQSLNRLEEALADAQQSIKITPSFHDGFVSIGNICNRMQRYEESVQAYQAALQLRPNNPQTLSNLGASLMDSHRYKESEIVLNEALKINPQFVQALNNRANLYTSIKRPEAALADINAALQLDPRFIEAYLNRGNILQDLNRIPESLTSYDKALEMNPQYAAAFNNKGNALKEIFQNKAALACYDQAITIQPAYAEAHYHRALALNEFQRYEEATAAFEKAVELKEDHPLLFGQWISSLMMICDWRDLPPKVARLSAKIRAGKNASTTFSILSCGVAPDLVKQSAQAFIQDKCWDRSQEYVYPSPHTNPRIRVGYFSSDFRNHAVSQLAVGLFENHDREKFEVFGFNISTLPPDEMTQRVAQAFGGLVELGSLSIRQSIEKIRSMNIDIAIDLNGHTKGAKMDIFAHRIAPIQVNYLGYPGTSGAPFMDYILGDQVIIPEDHFRYYTEKVAHLPGCYLPNDSKKVISEKTPTRGEAGLPEGAFVFCCFNNSYKFNAETFDVWLRLLQRVPGSVLWLSQVNEKAAQNLCARATSQGIEPTRLVFAPRTKDLADHLARHRLADLFLDTTRYNAHTTASDALWAGLPVLTCLGDSFPGRVAASLLSAMDMPELITNSLEQYESIAFELATNPDKLASVKTKLLENKSTRPLFDTPAFAEGMESVLAKMWNRYTQGLPPDHLPHEQRPAT